MMYLKTNNILPYNIYSHFNRWILIPSKSSYLKIKCDQDKQSHIPVLQDLEVNFLSHLTVMMTLKWNPLVIII